MDVLPEYCANQKMDGLEKIIQTMMDWTEVGFYPEPPTDTVRETFAQQVHTKLCDCVDR